MSDYQKVKNDQQLPFHLIVFDKNTSQDLHLYPRHWHEHLEIVVTIIGKGKVWIEGEEYQIKDNNVFVISPMVYHQVQGSFPYSDNVGYCLQIDLEKFNSLFPKLSKQYYPTCSHEVSSKIIHEINLLHQDMMNNKDNYDLIIRIIKVLQIIDKQKTIYPIQSEKYKNRLLQISQYIDNHYSESLDVEDIANHFNISVSYLQKLFKDYFQQSVHQYIVEIQMMHALDDLKYSDLNILDIALKNGFKSNKSFTNEFKKRFDITPYTYIKQIR